MGNLPNFILHDEVDYVEIFGWEWSKRSNLSSYTGQLYSSGISSNDFLMYSFFLHAHLLVARN